jgi:thiamine-monophosphate kinase
MGEQTLGTIGEFELINKVVAGLTQHDAVLVGPGDDTAIIDLHKAPVLITVDVLVEGRHFRRDWSTAIEIGQKAAAASLADIAAMGATATALVVGFVAPPDLPAVWASGCTAGMAQEAATVGASIVGGDVSAGEQIVLSVTAIAPAPKTPVLRSGAHVGDQVAIAGRLGWSAAGLAVLSKGFRSPRALVNAHRTPQPPYLAGPAACAAGATAMIDVSDGLIADARHIAQASNVLIAIDPRRLRIDAEVAQAATAYNLDPLLWVLTGGEDHALLATFPAQALIPADFTVIGTVEKPGDDGPGVSVGGIFDRSRGGHQHFGS